MAISLWQTERRAILDEGRPPLESQRGELASRLRELGYRGSVAYAVGPEAPARLRELAGALRRRSRWLPAHQAEAIASALAGGLV